MSAKDCGCHASERRIPGAYNPEPVSKARIIYCPLHAAAHELADVLERCASHLSPLIDWGQDDDDPIMHAAINALYACRDLLAKMPEAKP